jgi:hypothetical protein
MTTPLGALTTIEEMRNALEGGTRFLYLAPATEKYPLKFEMLDPTLRWDNGNGHWLINKAHDITRNNPFPTGVVAFCVPPSTSGWWWFKNYWHAWAAQMKANQKGSE